MEYPTLYAITLFLLVWYKINGEEFTESTQKICGARSLFKLISNDAYWTQSKHSYYKSCKFIHARYNCTRFGTTSVSDYRIAFKSSSLSCKIPNDDIHTIISLLTSQSNPIHMIFIGDSHIMQIFQSILCIFQDVVQDIDVFVSNTDITDQFTKITYKSYLDAEECHAIKYKDYDNFHLEKVEKTSGRCQLSHDPGQVSCFKIPISSSNQVDSNRKYTLVCASFARLLTGMSAVMSSLGSGLSGINLQVNDFDVIFANAYMSANDVGIFLKQYGYYGKVYLLPRYPEAPQIGFKYSTSTITENIDWSQVYLLQKEMKRFCNDMNRIIWNNTINTGLGTNTPLSIARRLSSSSEKMCHYFDYSVLISQRSADAKSSIYPFVYYDKKNRLKTCQLSSNSSSSCIGKDFRVCSSQAYPCGVESHFCLPGPTDELALLALTAALSYNDYSSVV